MSNIFFTSDQHYGHYNIIRYCNRPFETLEEMDQELIKRHNEVVSPKDTVYHLGDFCFSKTKSEAYQKYINKLNGANIFIRGSHDYWLPKNHRMIIEKKINNVYITMCHYAMRVWPRSHYGSWHLYGHSHGKLDTPGKTLDVGVDSHDFYPVSFDKIVQIMKDKNNE